jgi:hypothetical protein
MSKLVWVAGVLWAATFLVAVASAQDPTIPSEPAPGVMTAEPLASYILPSSQSPRNSPLGPGAESARPSKSLDVDLKVDGNGVRLGGRISGSKGVSQAWLGAQLRGDGVTVDGRLQGNDGPTRDFKLNVDLLPGWARTAARIWLMLP